jgi:hypothetical protein
MTIIDSSIEAYPLPFSFSNSAPPKWISNTQFSMNYIAERAQSNDYNIFSSTPLTLSTGSLGAGGMLQSANLSGTVSVNNGSVTGTGTSFLTDFVVGDVITVGSFSGRVTATPASNTSMTTTSFSASGTYKRGGMCADTNYYLYVIAKDQGVSPSLVLSTRSLRYGHVLVDLPSTYIKYKEICFSAYLDASKNIAPFRICEGWPGTPVILYQNSTQLLSGALSTNSSSPTTLTSSRLPLTAGYAVVTVVNTGTIDVLCYSRENNRTSGTNNQYILNKANSINPQFSMILNNLTMKFYAAASGQTVAVNLLGYIIV